MAVEVDLEKCNFRNFTTDLDLGSDHTAYCRASVINLYLHTKFHRNRKNFLWKDVRTDIPTDVPTDGRTFPL